ncbi:MAG: MATE family efflux transporter [Christensenellaceae bacterium]|jgi:Na+-driven multidrug efflux pump
MEQTTNKIAKEFNFWSLARFAFPTLVMSLFMSIFKTIDDGLFVSNYVGKDALSAINIVWPLTMIVFGVGMMLATGCSAVAAIKIGNGRPEEAKSDFTAMTLFGIVFGCIIAAIGLLFRDPLLHLFGATEMLMEDCKTYATIIFLAMPISMITPIFGFFYVTAGKPTMGLVSAILNGTMNIVFDYIFIVQLQMGVVGAALATVLGDLSICILGLVFYWNKKHEIHFAKPTKKWIPLLGRVSGAGVAQFANHVAMGVSAFISNLVMLRIVGEDGIAAYAILGYLQ